MPRASKDVNTITTPLTGGLGVITTTPSANPGTDFSSPPDSAAKTPYDPDVTNYYVKELVGNFSKFTSQLTS